MTKAKRVCPIKGSGGGSAEGAVSYAEEQSLTKIQKDRARRNIGAASEEELSGKANNDGYYSKMTVGAAESLVGGNDISREFAGGTAGGTADIADGIVQVERIKGNTIVWNQMFGYGNIGSDHGLTQSYDSARNCMVINGTATGNGHFYNIIGSHKYSALPTGHRGIFVIEHVGGNFEGSANAFIGISSGIERYNISNITTTPIKFRKYSNGDSLYILVEFKSGDVFSNYAYRVNQFDLTAMFGAGNEPATVAEFEKMFPLDYYNYNAGQLLSLNPTGIKTVGFNAYNHTTDKAYVIGEKQYQITGAYTSITEDDTAITPDSDGIFTPTKNGEITIAGGDSTTCVHLVWSGVRNGEFEQHWEEIRNIDIASILYQGSLLFADGLCSVGSVYDEVTPKKAIKRITKQTITGAIGDEITLSGCKLSATEYKSVSDYGTLENGVLTLTAAVTDKDVLYELATPIEVTFAEPINLNYRVSDFGTETLLPVNTSIPVTTPIRIDAVYGLNVVDFVRNADNKFITIEDKTGDNGSSFTNLRSALSSSFGIDIVPAFDSENKRYTFTVTDNRNVEVPESATASGTKGTWAEDETAVYFCTDTDTWIKINKETW